MIFSLVLSSLLSGILIDYSIIFEYVLSVNLCEGMNHYVDGMMFGAIFGLLSVMMVYKYWDSITRYVV